MERGGQQNAGLFDVQRRAVVRPIVELDRLLCGEDVEPGGDGPGLWRDQTQREGPTDVWVLLGVLERGLDLVGAPAEDVGQFVDSQRDAGRGQRGQQQQRVSSGVRLGLGGPPASG